MTHALIGRPLRSGWNCGAGNAEMTIGVCHGDMMELPDTHFAGSMPDATIVAVLMAGFQ